jgi:alpha-glucosidase
MEPVIVAPWYRQATLYQIYPLSFADSNGDGFGDIPGIIKHLDYLNDGTSESLGVGAIWLSPIYASPMADFGYDVADHKAIDPKFGTMEDFERLIREVHGRDMKLLMDFVPNHTSVRHKWFSEARRSQQSPKRDWYTWADPAGDGGPPNNWLSHFGGSAWTFDEGSGQYYLHSFLPEQPDLNWRNPRVREEMLDVLSFWLDKGVDGFRTDAVLSLLKDEQLRNDPPNPNYVAGKSNPTHEFLRSHSAGEQVVNEVIGSFCEVLAEKPNSFLLSEAYLNIPGLHHMYQACWRHPVHAPFNFNLMTLEWGAGAFRSFIDEYEESLGPEDWPNYVIGNHDRSRVVSRLGVRRARLLAMLQLTLRGLPVVYYGEELGLPDSEIENNEIKDPLELRLPGFGLGRDPERTPMPWNSHNAAGFTTVESWLPMDVEARKLNVAAQERQPESMLSFYRHLIRLRNASPALSEGDYRSLKLGNENVFGYIRETEFQRFLVVLNFGDKPTEVKLSSNVGSWIAGTHEVLGDGDSPVEGNVRLRAFEGRMYEMRQRGE